MKSPLALLLLSLALSACHDPDAHRLAKEAAEAWEALSDYTSIKGREFLDEFGTEFDRMQQQIDGLTEDAREELKDELESLRGKREELRRELEDAKREAWDEWPEVKRDILDAARDLDDAIAKAIESAGD